MSPLAHTSSWHTENFTFLQDVKNIEYRKKESKEKKFKGRRKRASKSNDRKRKL
jgi:hypothetical protein